MLSDEILKPVFAAQIRTLRRQANLSQKELAEMVSCDRKTINRIECGQRLPDAVLLYALADALGVSADDLRRLSEPAEKKLLVLS